MTNNITINANLQDTYPDIYATKVLAVLTSLANNKEIKEATTARIKRRKERQENFLI